MPKLPVVQSWLRLPLAGANDRFGQRRNDPRAFIYAAGKMSDVYWRKGLDYLAYRELCEFGSAGERAGARGSRTAFSSHPLGHFHFAALGSGGRGGTRTHGDITATLDFESSTQMS